MILIIGYRNAALDYVSERGLRPSQFRFATSDVMSALNGLDPDGIEIVYVRGSDDPCVLTEQARARIEYFEAARDAFRDPEPVDNRVGSG